MKKITILMLAAIMVSLLPLELMSKEKSTSDKEITSAKKPVAIAKIVVGKVLRKSRDSKKWTALKLNSQLFQDDGLKIIKNSRIVISFPDGKLVSISKEGTVSLKEIIERKETLKKKGFFSGIKSKILDEKSKSSGVTSVAGVRGKEAKDESKKITPGDLYWTVEPEQKETKPEGTKSSEETKSE